jgi:hypothetical protein
MRCRSKRRTSRSFISCSNRRSSNCRAGQPSRSDWSQSSPASRLIVGKRSSVSIKPSPARLELGVDPEASHEALQWLKKSAFTAVGGYGEKAQTVPQPRLS